MRYIRLAILGVVMLGLVLLALANRGAVTLRLLPADIANLVNLGWAAEGITVPLFAVIFAGVLLGLLLGFLAEWVREHKFRAEAARDRRENKRLSRELAEAKTDEAEGDDILAILDGAGSAR